MNDRVRVWEGDGQRIVVIGVSHDKPVYRVEQDVKDYMGEPCWQRCDVQATIETIVAKALLSLYRKDCT